MLVYRSALVALWLVFVAVWIAAARGAKKNARAPSWWRALGIALAIWARIYLGRNWGFPMSRKVQPELVTTGPYAFVRHSFLVAGAYFIYSARTEERIMAETFPDTYPAYRRHTKMLVPFLL